MAQLGPSKLQKIPILPVWAEQALHLAPGTVLKENQLELGRKLRSKGGAAVDPLRLLACKRRQVLQQPRPQPPGHTTITGPVKVPPDVEAHSDSDALDSASRRDSRQH